VAQAFFGEDIPKEKLDAIVADTLNFEIPLHKVEKDVYVLELFHGPTFAFKDVGARFMARMLSYFVKEQGQSDVKVLVATSGDTGSAVANGFLGVEGIQVFVLYPSGKVSDIQEAQFTTLGRNIVALEIDGTFDDCQALVKSAFMDDELNRNLNLTSANSINVARFSAPIVLLLPCLCPTGGSKQCRQCGNFRTQRKFGKSYGRIVRKANGLTREPLCGSQ